MLDVIKATLKAWVSQLDAQRVSESNYSDEHDVYLDYKVLGVATFLKHVAYQQDDLELLAIASKVEMQVEQMILADDEEQDEAEQERQEMQQRIYESDEIIRKACIHHFYTEPVFSVDMSKYEAMIQASAQRFSDPYKLSSLSRYVDREQVLARIFEKVKNRLRRTSAMCVTAPALADVVQAFETELQVIYRLADAHVERTIALYAKAT